MQDFQSKNKKHSIAIIGSRKASRAGLRAAFEFADFASSWDASVVSGLALGCDTAAHLGSLESGGHTIAVLPCGLNFIAPVSNRPLAKRIVANGGELFSEYSPNTPPRNFRFVERNRVISALSEAAIVIEADLRSGTMHTARFALEQHKPVACYVPESGPMSSGCRYLLENHGATPLRNAADLELFLEAFLNEPKQMGRGGWRV